MANRGTLMIFFFKFFNRNRSIDPFTLLKNKLNIINLSRNKLKFTILTLKSTIYINQLYIETK